MLLNVNSFLLLLIIFYVNYFLPPFLHIHHQILLIAALCGSLSAHTDRRHPHETGNVDEGIFSTVALMAVCRVCFHYGFTNYLYTFFTVKT